MVAVTMTTMKVLLGALHNGEGGERDYGTAALEL